MKNLRFIIMVITLLVTTTTFAADLKSQAQCIPGIFKCLNMANPTGLQWHMANQLQLDFYNLYASAAYKDMDKFDPKVLDGIASNDATVIVKFFEERNFPGITVNLKPGEMAYASAFNLFVDWVVQGEKTSKQIDGIRYDYVHMSNKHKWGIYELEDHKYPLIKLETKQGWTVFLVQSDEGIDYINLTDQAFRLMKGKSSKSTDYGAIEFPFIFFEREQDISFLQKMWLADKTGKPFFWIAQTFNKVRFRLDDKGASGESITLVTMCGIGPKTYVVTKPMIVMFYRNDLSQPPFVAHACQDSWVRWTRETK